MRFKNTFD